MREEPFQIAHPPGVAQSGDGRAPAAGAREGGRRRRRSAPLVAARIRSLCFVCQVSTSGKTRSQRRVHGAHRPAVHFVGLQPLEEDPARRESRARRAVEVRGEEARDAGPVGIRRLGEDDVVASRARSSSHSRASPIQMRTRGLPSTSWLTGAQSRATRRIAGSSSTTSTRSMEGTAASQPAVDPVPSPITSARRGLGWSAAPMSPPMTCVAASPRELPSILPEITKA